MTEDEIDVIYVATTGKTRWEEAKASASMLGCGLLTVIVFVVVGFIIIIAD
jgi:hypothetical protein